MSEKDNWILHSSLFVLHLFHVVFRHKMMIPIVFYTSYESVLDVYDLVGLVGHTAFMSHHHNGHAFFLVQFLQQVHHLDTCLGIECTGRFIGKDNLWFGNEARAMATRCFCPPDISLG